ncbi:MAG: hypothetical protein FJ125_00270 [Deltaproteobacteria bacterium]|nr:hypothetical protein [Deltaproteobacteria bacterium]
MTTSRNRRDALSGQTDYNGIDFVEIANEQQTELLVHFLNENPGLAGRITGARIHGGETIPEVEVHPIAAGDFGLDAAGRPLLTLHVAAPGDFSIYTLTLEHDGVLDPYLDHTAFSFKAGCRSTLDCATRPPSCPPEVTQPPPIDYLAKDFLSLRQALSDFSALRWPMWRERAEADFGMMWLEALASLADDLSYLQDQLAGEATLETATERVSLVRHARLVDYEPRPATAARVVLRLTLGAGEAYVAPGQPVAAPLPEGGTIGFETGTGLDDASLYRVRRAWNRLEPYWWDDGERCLRRGATELWVHGQGLDLGPGQLLLIDTAAASDPAEEEPCCGAPPRAGGAPQRQFVQLVATEERRDELYGEDLTLLRWRSEDALRADHDLARTEVAGNLVPATQGLRRTEQLAIGHRPTHDTTTPLAIERRGANGTIQYLLTLAGDPLAYLAPLDDPAGLPWPEIRVEQLEAGSSSVASRPWAFRRRLLDAEEFESSFTLDPVRYRRLGPDMAAGAAEHDGSDGATVRFGDGTFGEIPEEGKVFRVTYRVGGGAAGNVAADSITFIPPDRPLAPFVVAVTNPLPAEGGAEMEPDQQVRDLAPQAFSAVQYRAVLPADYQAAAETLRWVDHAGTSFRWTGSWLTVFTALDRLGSMELPADLRAEAVALLDRYRLAGYESYVLPPCYAPLDLRISVCARSDAFHGDVEGALLERLRPSGGAAGREPGFFHPDSFTFGQPLQRSALEAAIQRTPGVAGVLEISYRRRGRTLGFVTLPDTVTVGRDEIVCMDDDPNRPERGSLRITVEGGK